MRNGSRWRKGIALFVVLLFGLLGSTFLPAPLPVPLPIEASLPRASPPPEMEVFQLPTGTTHRSAAFAYRGGSFLDRRDFAMTALFVRHPRGDLLIDTGFGERIEEHFRMMPRGFQWITKYARGRSAAAQLRAAGYDLRNLPGILLTHAHWDHVSGVPDFPNTPVLVNAEERRFIERGGFLTVVARSAPRVRYEEYRFESGPYLGFPRSHDVYGDGSIVVVPAEGHTPGSVVVFLAMPGGRRAVLLGDLVWQREGITLREERPFLQRWFGDHDAAGVRTNILRVAAIHARYPLMELVPAHDARGFETFPSLNFQHFRR